MEKIYELLNNLRPELDYRDSQNFIEDGMLDSFDVVALKHTILKSMVWILCLIILLQCKALLI